MEIKIFCINKELLPKYQTLGSAGLDLCSNENITIPSNQIKLISTGVYLELPELYEAQVRSRSGLATKGIFVLNSPGTIDSDYRGEIKVILFNISKDDYEIKIGDRIAQMVINKYTKTSFCIVDSLSELTITERNKNGFGSTGINK